MNLSSEHPLAGTVVSTAHLRPAVLVVDDEPAVRHLFHRIVTHYFPDVYVASASHGQEALDCFADDYFPVVLSDLHMPVMTGEEAFHRIQFFCESHCLPQPSFIFCTGLDAGDTIRKIVGEHPEHRLLSKPVDVDTVVNSVRASLRRYTSMSPFA